MFTGMPLDRRTHAILMLRMLAEQAEDQDVPLTTLGEIARELSDCLLEQDEDCATPSGRPALRVIEGGLC